TRLISRRASLVDARAIMLERACRTTSDRASAEPPPGCARSPGIEGSPSESGVHARPRYRLARLFRLCETQSLYESAKGAFIREMAKAGFVNPPRGRVESRDVKKTGGRVCHGSACELPIATREAQRLETGRRASAMNLPRLCPACGPRRSALYVSILFRLESAH